MNQLPATIIPFGLILTWASLELREMAYFLVRVTVNAFALTITVFLLPGVQIYAWDDGPIPLLFTYLIMGTLFGLINALVRPFVLLLTGKLLLWTMGVFTWVVNTLLLIILTYVAPAVWAVQRPILLWAILAGIIMGITVRSWKRWWAWIARWKMMSGKCNFIGAGLANYPAADGTGSSKICGYSMVYDIMRRYGLEIAIGETPLSNFRQWMQQRIYPDRQMIAGLEAPVKVRLMLQELGPTFVKLGQMAASRSDVLQKAGFANWKNCRMRSLPSPTQRWSDHY